MKEMRAKFVVAIALTTALLFSVFVFAEKPEHDISGRRHPNLAAAQRLSDQAYQRILDAQRANEWDLDGHAQKAKELLEQVNHELKEAAEASNHRH